MRKVLFVIAMLSVPSIAHADYKNREIGNWLVSGEDDRFGDGGRYTALTAKGNMILAVRCLTKTLSLAVLNGGDDQKPYDKGDRFEFKLRVDKKPVVETRGNAINHRLIQLETPRAVVLDMADGSELAIRMTNEIGTSNITIFKMRGSKRAFAHLLKECPSGSENSDDASSDDAEVSVPGDQKKGG